MLPGLISQEYAVLAVGVLGVLAFSTLDALTEAARDLPAAA